MLNYSPRCPAGRLKGRLTIPLTLVERDHNQLLNRDAPDQHPIESISGLSEELDCLYENQTPFIPITNEELEEILV